MIPKVIHFTVPKQITPLQSEMISLARQMNPGWEVKVWQDPVSPDDFVLSNLWQYCNSGAQKADLIRLEVVHRQGGIYLDSDVRVLKPLDSIAESCAFFICTEDGHLATNAIFGAVAGHPALKELIEQLRSAPPDWSIMPNITTGPVFFSRNLQWRNDVTVLPRATFYPYNWNQSVRDPHPHTYAVHEWAGSWKDDGQRSKLKTLKRAIQPSRFLPKSVARRVLRAANHIRHTSEAVIRAQPPLKGYSVSDHLVRKTVHGHFICLFGSDVSVTPEIMANGYYELREELFLRRILSGGDYFIDVGANVGVYSLLAASLVGRFGRVFSYEPNPAVGDLLRKSAVMNWMHDRIDIRPTAVGDKPAVSKLLFSAARLGDAALQETSETESTSKITRDFVGDASSVDVKVVTLDQEFSTDLPIRALKIDAEGYEIAVLAGAERMLSRACIDFIILEAIPEVAGRSWGRLMQSISEIEKKGYELCKFEFDGRLSTTSSREIEISGTGASRNVVLRRKGAST